MNKIQFGKIIDNIVGLILKINDTESKLRRYQGYRSHSCVTWKRRNNIEWPLVFKILKKLRILNGMEIRNIISSLVEQNPEIFEGTFYVAAFGKIGKSGEMIMYEFNHCVKIAEERLIKVWDIPSLPPNSKIIFLEDFIGTGTQSLGYITNKVNLLLNPSHQAYLLTLCATPQAMERIQENTNFTILVGIKLEECEYQHYSNASTYFNGHKKERIIELNWQLKTQREPDYDLGMLIAFYYSIPNNSMPILWKDDFEYIDNRGRHKKWFALLPRKF